MTLPTFNIEKVAAKTATLAPIKDLWNTRSPSGAHEKLLDPSRRAGTPWALELIEMSRPSLNPFVFHRRH